MSSKFKLLLTDPGIDRAIRAKFRLSFSHPSLGFSLQGDLINGYHCRTHLDLEGVGDNVTAISWSLMGDVR
jgi:hypothetical protein